MKPEIAPDVTEQPAAPTGVACSDWLGVLREKAQRARRHGAWYREGTIIKRKALSDGMMCPVAVCRMNKVVNTTAINDCADFIAALDPTTVMQLLDMIDGKTPNAGTHAPRKEKL